MAGTPDWKMITSAQLEWARAKRAATGYWRGQTIHATGKGRSIWPFFPPVPWPVSDEFFGADSGAFEIQRCSSCGSLWLKNRPFGSRLLGACTNYSAHAHEDADGDPIWRPWLWNQPHKVIAEDARHA